MRRGCGASTSSSLSHLFQMGVGMVLCHSIFLALFGLRVSPRFQQELHSWRVTVFRDPNKRSLGILYIDKGIGTHTPYIEQEEEEAEK